MGTDVLLLNELIFKIYVKYIHYGTR